MQITADGKITIPPEMQQQLGLEPGTEVHLEIVGITLQLTRKTTINDLQFSCEDAAQTVVDHRAISLKSAFGCLSKRIDPQVFQAQVRNEWQC
jgi:antitoxin component of MazEF toxin-antitoxin module